MTSEAQAPSSPANRSALQAAQAYLDAWNRHDGEAVAELFSPGGRYVDPNLPDGAAGPALAAYVRALAAAFPDLRFEPVRQAAAGSDTVLLQWIMRGTNSGPIFGRPPTGGTIALAGVDLIRIENGSIARVQGFFDRRTLLEQLGLQVVINPPSVHPVAFGSSSHVEAGRSGTAGALSLTMIEVRGEEELIRVRLGTARIAPSLPHMTGFLGFLGGAVGKRLYTVTAWESPEQVRQIRNDASHTEMVRQVFTENLGVAMHTSVWLPGGRGRFWVRCHSCARLVDIRQEGPRCECGAEIEEIPPSW